MCNDPYDTGTPKYKTAQAIYDGLNSLTNSEEIGIISEMFADVSYDGQDYYYFDKGTALMGKFDEMSGYGEKNWLLDLAIFQIDGDEIHDVVYEALINSDLAKRIDFKKLFIEIMLRGDKRSYDEVAEGYLAEVQELNRFQYYEMLKAFNKVMEERGQHLYTSPYPAFCHALGDKVRNLRLAKESQLIAECRALLTSYDDFILGLRMNQALYESQERQYEAKVAQLHENYRQRIMHLYLIAESQGIVLDEQTFAKLLEDK